MEQCRYKCAIVRHSYPQSDNYTVRNNVRKEEGVSSMESIGEVTGKWRQDGPREISGDAHSFKEDTIVLRHFSLPPPKKGKNNTSASPLTDVTAAVRSLYDAEAWMKVHAADFPAISVDEDARNLSPWKPRPKSRRKRAKLHAILSGVQWIEKVRIIVANDYVAIADLLSSRHYSIIM